MPNSAGRLLHSPADLVDLLECEHRTRLTLALAHGLPGAPAPDEPRRPSPEHTGAHERAVLARLAEGREVVTVPDTPDAAERTAAALADRVPVIRGATFHADGFHGRADFLVAADLGTGHGTGHGYEPHGAELAHHATPAAVVRLTAFALALGADAGPHTHLHLADGTTRTFRVADFLPLVSDLRNRLRARASQPPALPERLWDDERPACATCRFGRHCASGRERDRDLSLVAGIRTDQRRKLRAAGLATIDALARATAADKPVTMSATTFQGLRAQAALQVVQDRSRTAANPTGEVAFELVAPEALAALPVPDPGDLFLDVAGYPHALDGEGLEFLFGAVDAEGAFTPSWAHTRPAEKAAFEGFVDLVVGRLEANPGAHVYHYTPHEVEALKRLAALHGTREDAVDHLLRSGALVDLHAVVRKALRVSQRSYSIRHLEPLFAPGRTPTALPGAEAYEEYLALREVDPERAGEVLAGIAGGVAADCAATLRLYRFLLDVRAEAGVQPHVPEPSFTQEIEDELAAQRRAERAARLAAVVDPLLEGLPDNPAEATDDERARALLAAAVGYHRRETNPAWWDFFRRMAAPLPELEADSACAVPVSVRADDWVLPSGRVRRAKREVRVWCDPERPHPFAPGDQVRLLYKGTPNRSRDAVVLAESAEDVVLQESTAPDEVDGEQPIAVLPGSPVRPTPKDEAVYDLAAAVVDVLPELPPHPGVDLVRRTPPRLRTGALPRSGDVIADVIAAVDALEGSTLAVQGPPGAGKTYLAGRLIAHLIRGGRSVGVTSTSHKAVENVLSAALAAGRELGVPIPTAKRPKGTPARECAWEQPRDNPALVRWRNDQGAGHLVGGTAWTFANTALREQPFDVLIVDEAGQFALADALAVSTCARNLVLLGDPQQLPQVVQGTHPAGAEASALGHLIGDADVIPPELGYFLDQTRRMHPAVCEPVSNLSYAGLLHAHPSAAARGVAGVPPGVYLRSVEHSGNTTSSAEEAAAVVGVVRSLMGRMWTDGPGARALDEDDFLVVAPYNVQVRLVRRLLEKQGYEGVRVGTVDRFQGQEAPVVITTMTSSAAVDLPRGLDFLLSRNRLNVALSRAQAVAVVVCSPRLVEADVRDVDQLRLVSGMIGLMAGAASWDIHDIYDQDL
ncbi:TM0106 family RecB-like putative nuclease [Saccharothrix syringae]|uniref:TM0106 family RecB-like putative nuclease n=1 Tax=Saccharothrix syringae TaxID=103733 RepID=A0A5Q0H8C8_SACSY|nr:TM0106 family RecB-like putative nuclease [Saccharothrix syringae]QFZ22165.1 TM0106 family RecB-like putative nuclease [Saccharothrix syringae]